MEKIYTIPVNEAFDHTDACPFCRMKRELDEKEVDLILGASMMEPDVRIQTNAKGFCGEHYEAMWRAQKRLPLALILESHLEEIRKACRTPRLSIKEKTGVVAHHAESFADGCYICDRVEFHLAHMFETACLLWESDGAFRKKFATQDHFCLPCYVRLLKTAMRFLAKKTLPEFLDAAQTVEQKYLDNLKSDVSQFCRKFDYRYQKEPWGTARDAVERAIRFLSGEGILAEDTKKSSDTDDV